MRGYSLPNPGGSTARRTWCLLGILEGIHEAGKLVAKDFPSVEVCGNDGALSLAGCSEGRFTGTGYFNVELAAVMGVSVPRDQAPCLQAGQDAAHRLALNMDNGGELFLVQGAGRRGSKGNDCGPGQAQRCQCVVKAALNKTGRCGEEQVAIPDVRRGVEVHR